MLAAAPPGRRLRELSPFELRPDGTVVAPDLSPGSDYGCVEWFKYVDRPQAPPAAPFGQEPPHGRGVRRP